MTRHRAVSLTRIALIIAAIGALELACRTGLIKPLVMIAPSAMLTTLVTLLRSGTVTEDIAQTFATVAAAFALAIAAGFALGALIHALPRLRSAIDPLLASYYAVPFFVFYPLLVAIFGLNQLPLIAIGLLFATPAMMLATLNGLDRVPRVLHRVARIHHLSRVQDIRLVTLPSAAPHLLAGVKLAFAYAFIGVIAGEFILAGGGLGYSIAYAYENFENAKMYALMLFVLLVATGVNFALHAWETHLQHRRAR